ncbi:nucleoside deaminase [Neobacillus sp. SuZ13]|uniref:nucleoside deaminase n=1 Tax=Neobacillus sp. SuZ13 TaxID=3047875 RepID=UPI0024BF1CEA|nr:nucleoside deaminase [Neobacillus sp. SuZ13]WHY67910.1 nucleoside deaminase [Neobacillus sp. SuZ13]
MTDTLFMEKAIELALNNVLTNQGGPFGAVVVKDGKIVGVGRNQVTGTNDPTAHAEVQAIRDACRNLNDFQLNDCEIYTSCEPCPMCIGAIYWARPKAVYYACTKQEAAKIGFDDQFIYDQLSLPVENRKIPMKKIFPTNGDLPFKTWENAKDKVEY